LWLILIHNWITLHAIDYVR